MLQLILHGIGDYFLQTDWQALNKKKAGWLGFWACLKHCMIYSLPFLFIGSWQAVTAIFVTHFIIDRYNIVAYLLAWKNNTKHTFSMQMSDSHGLSVGDVITDGVQSGRIAEVKNNVITVKSSYYDISNFGFHKERPFAISIWLYIICDNLCHIICNYLAIKYL